MIIFFGIVSIDPEHSQTEQENTPMYQLLIDNAGFNIIEDKVLFVSDIRSIHRIWLLIIMGILLIAILVCVSIFPKIEPSPSNS